MSGIDRYFQRRREMAAAAVAAFEAGENVVNTLATRFPGEKQEAIEIAYELQAGSYTAARDDPAARAYRAEQQRIVATEVLPLCEPAGGPTLSLLDAGTGEGSAWYGFDFAATKIGALHAIDISLRRLSHVEKNIAAPPALRVTPVRADVRNLPYWPGSFDIALTMHAIEPNGGNEAEILGGLAALTSNILCLFEPDHATASPDAQARMASLGYAREIFASARALAGFDIVFERKLNAATNPLNPTSVICLRRKNPRPGIVRRKSPAAALDLIDRGDHFAETGPGASAIFPVIGGIECMRTSDAVLKLGD